VSEHAPVLVIGGGIVGVSAAWFLAERGTRVTLLEKGEVASGCSYGNAGWIFPSHSMPIPSPRVPRSALRFVGDVRSPLYVRLRMDRDSCASVCVSPGRVVRSALGAPSA
jgi:D-amino-acid dehydrogenase